MSLVPSYETVPQNRLSIKLEMSRRFIVLFHQGLRISYEEYEEEFDDYMFRKGRMFLDLKDTG